MMQRIMKEKNTDTQLGDQIDWRELLLLLWDGRHVIAACTGLFLTAAIAYAMTLTPIYRANGFVLFEETAKGIPNLDDTTQTIGSDSSAAKELFVVKSRMVLGNVVDELDLTTVSQPTHFPLIGAAMARRHASDGIAAPPFGLKSYAWGGEQIKVSYLQVPRNYLDQPLELIVLSEQQFSLSHNGQKLLTGNIGEPSFGLSGTMEIIVDRLIARPGTRFNVQKSPRFNTILALQSALSVSEKGKGTGILEIAFDGPERQHIVKVVDSVAANYYYQSVRRLADKAESSLTSLDQKILAAKLKLSRAEAALNNYRSERNSVDLPLEAAAALESLVQIEADINAMSINEAGLARRFMPEHPNYISFTIQQENLQLQRDRLNTRLTQLPEVQKKILSLTRDYETTQAVFVSLDNRRQELEILKASSVNNVRLLDSAGIMPGIEATKPKLIAVLGALLGGMLGVMIILLRFRLKSGIIDPKAFSRIGLTVHTTIPYSENELTRTPSGKQFKSFRRSTRTDEKLRINVLACDHPDDASIEAFRNFRIRLRFLMMNAKNNLAMISSGSPGVGKSFVCANLATVAAKSGQRVLVVDGDLSSGHLHRSFGVNPHNGLAEVLAGTIGINDAISTTMVDNLHFMPSGEMPINPSELLAGPALSKLTKWLSAVYDMVIFDTPPILEVTDAAIIGRHCGTKMMIARFEQCTIREITAAKSRFNLNGVDIDGIVFNAVRKKAENYYHDEKLLHGNYYQAPTRLQTSMPIDPTIVSTEELESLGILRRK